MKPLLILAFALTASAQTTPNLSLNIPTPGTENWGNLLNTNFSTIDSLASNHGTGWVWWPLTTKGDLYVYCAGPSRLPIGTNGLVLTADSTQTCGMGWESIYPPGAGIANYNGTGWGTSYGTSGTGNVALTTNAVFTTPNLGTPSALICTHCTGLPGAQITGATSIPASTLPLATTMAFGAIKPDGTTCTVSGGVLTCNGTGATYTGSLPITVTGTVIAVNQATGSTFGVIKPDGTSCTVSAGVLTCPGTSGLTPGPSGSLTISGGVIDNASAVMPYLANYNPWTGGNDFTGASFLKVVRGSTAPPCSVAGDEGSQWLNTTSATANHYEVCAEVSGTVGWQTIF